MLDTNVLISTVYNPDSVPARAYYKTAQPDFTLVLCDQIIDELRRVFNRKFPSKIASLERFLDIAQYDLATITDEDNAASGENAIRDAKDRPILRAAVKADIDILVTGDKDFTEAGIERPQVMTPAEFLDMA